LGISGANFLVAETGTLALIENEGNIRLSTSAPRIHLALVGIEKLLPSFSDLALFLQLTPRAATGQRIGNYVSLIHGPRRSSESDGPAALHVILVDNGRTRLLNDPETWEILRCVRCGACLNICPVFRQVGGHAWGWAYSGPIGTVLAQGILGLNRAWLLLYACSLCGACTEVCPVRVPLHRLILAWRARAAAMKLPGWTESMAMKSFAHRLSQPLDYQRASTLLRHFPASWRDALVPFFRTWAKGRYHLAPSPKSFHELWLDQEGE
jgi:L-lactate dehydrogenase complex protein LldF